MKLHNNQKYQYNEEELKVLSHKIMDNFDIFINKLNLDLVKMPKFYKGVCFHPNANNPTALNIYHQELNGMVGNWRCYTHQCEKKFGRSIFGFLRGVLNKSFIEAINYAIDTLKINKQTLEINDETVEQSAFIKQCNILSNKETKCNIPDISDEQIRTRLIIPSPYCLKRGFSAEVLNKFNIGDCHRKGKYFYKRTVIPIYDSKGKQTIGFTGRSLNGRTPKWLHSKGFDKENCLFNYWNAKEEIKKTHTAILTEGPFDCINLYSKGIKNVVSVFGTSLNQGQMLLLNKCSALTLIVMFDNDEPGKKASQKIIDECQLYRLFFPKIEDDPGSMTQTEVTKELTPLLEKLK